MSRLINNENLQHYTNKMCNADNRKVGSKSLPTALNDIDALIDEMKVHFDEEYGSPLDMKLENNKNVFSVGTGVDIDRRDDVENSFTDIEVSGNSLVNLCPETYKFVNAKTSDLVLMDGNDLAWDSDTYRIKAFAPVHPLKPNTTYTIIVNVVSMTNINSISSYVKYPDDVRDYGPFSVSSVGLHVRKFTTTDQQAIELAFYVSDGDWSAEIKGLILLEGDWTDKSIPYYFKGLKSIGEKEDGNHKINVSSISRNVLQDTNEFKNANGEWRIKRGEITEGYSGNKGLSMEYSGEGIYLDCLSQLVTYDDVTNNKILEDSWYTLSFYAKGGHVQSFIYPNVIDTTTKGYINGVEQTIYIDGYVHHILTNDWKRYTITFKTKSSFINSEINNRILFRMHPGFRQCVVSSIMLEPGKVATEYEERIVDSKQILLNEPLRGLPNGIRDTIEKINGEWKIVRRCGEAIINGSLTYYNHSTDSPDFDEYKVYDFPVNNIKQSTSISDRFPQTANDRIICVSKLLYIRFGKEKQIDTLEKCQQWFETNPTKVIYELETPIIEDISPITLQCWKNGTISIDEVLPVETTHTVALNKPAQIKRNIEELTELRNRVNRLEDTLDVVTLEQALQFQLLNHSINLDK